MNSSYNVGIAEIYKSKVLQKSIFYYEIT